MICKRLTKSTFKVNELLLYLSCNRSSSNISNFKLFTMPQLSPTMLTGVISKWHIKETDLITPYQLVIEISTNSLTNTSNEVSVMEIEVVEGELYVDKLLVKEGEIVNIGKPIAIFKEKNEFSINIGEEELGKLSSVMWQAYVKSKSDSGACGCS